jgi:hypothetical protein
MGRDGYEKGEGQAKKQPFCSNAWPKPFCNRNAMKTRRIGATFQVLKTADCAESVNRFTPAGRWVAAAE